MIFNTLSKEKGRMQGKGFCAKIDNTPVYICPNIGIIL